MQKNIKGVLKQAMVTHQLVGTYSDPSNMLSFLVGYVDAIDNTKVRLRSVSPEGENAGYEILRLNEIYRVDVNTFYLRKIDFIQNNSGQIFSEIELIQPAENSDILFSTLREVKYKRVIVILWAEDEDDSIIGYVESLTPETVQILSIDDYGREDGFVVININEIVSIGCNARKEQILGFLHEKGFGN